MGFKEKGNFGLKGDRGGVRLPEGRGARRKAGHHWLETRDRD